jgi:excinuclease UvrABC helicase subunit UvrB
LQQFRPQVLMIHTRAVATQYLQTEEFSAAIKEIEAGIERLREFYEDNGRHDLMTQSPEISALQHWLEEVNRKRPMSKREQLEQDVSEAVKHEDYEKAAKVRDALKRLKPTE